MANRLVLLFQMAEERSRGGIPNSVASSYTRTPVMSSDGQRAEKRFGGRVFRVGDKVAQIRNNYDKGATGVFNGTQGVITAPDPVE